jgi:glyceraldehyde-3-phosphate dehydrogenase/erythrose-4-phosphate dehydrogenase
MSIQFKHLRDSTKGGATIAVNIESADLSKVEINTVIGDIKLGMSVCSTKDSFNKKIGRELAISRLKTTAFRVTRVSKSILDNGKISTKIILEATGFYISFTRSSESANFHLSGVVLTS